MRSIITVILLQVSIIGLSQAIKVGVYPNPPLINIDESGNISGFTVDLLKDIALKEGWQLDFKIYNLSDCLDALERDEISLMPAIAYSIERDSSFLLTNTNVITNWAKLYKHKDDDFHYSSVDLLTNKKIAVLAGDYYLKNNKNGLIDLLDNLDIPAEVKRFSSYERVIDEVESGRSDLGLVSRYYGSLETDDNEVVKTPINLAYTSVRFGFSKNPDNVLIVELIDKNLQKLINDRNSNYYQLEKKYLSFTPQEFIPQWLWQVFIIILICLIVLALFIAVLEFQIKRKTAELKKTNQSLVRSEHEARLAVQTIETSQDIGFWFQAGNPFIRVNQAAINLTGFSESELLAMVPRDLVASDKNREYYESLRHDKWGGHLLIEETFRTKSGEPFPVELSLDQFELDGQTYICGFARNITARLKAELELVERNKELNCLYSVAQHIAKRENTVDAVFVKTVDATLSAWLHPEVTVSRIEFLGREYKSKGYKDPVSLLNEPILSGETEVGQIEVGYSEPMPGEDKGPFLKEEVSLLNGVAKQLSRMLDSRDAERRIISSILTTEDKERSRISKELHDSVGQTLSAISLNINSLSKSNKLDESERKKLVSIDLLLKDAISESRSVSHNLMPPALTDLGYSFAVENLLSSIDKVGETKYSFHSNNSKREVAKEIEYALFRITQEAINNIIKYAEAKEVVIQYLVYEDVISLSIEDDGKGFDMNIADKKHNFGLNSMRNRATSINGELNIDTSPGKGTGVQLTVPLT